MLLLVRAGMQIVQKPNDASGITTNFWPLALQVWQGRFNEIRNMIAKIFTLQIKRAIETLLNWRKNHKKFK